MWIFASHTQGNIQEICFLPIGLFPQFFPEPTHAPSSLDSRVSPATRPTGFALFSGSTPRRPSHDAPQSPLYWPSCAPHHALETPHNHVGSGPRQLCLRREAGTLLAVPAARAPPLANPAMRCALERAKHNRTLRYTYTAVHTCCVHLRPPCCRTWWSHI